MKIYNIKITDDVHNFIGDLGEQIFKISFSFQISKKITDYIYKEIFSLKIFPNRYPKFNVEYRVLTISKKYRVFFKVDDEKMNVTVSNIFFSSENYSEIFIDNL